MRGGLRWSARFIYPLARPMTEEEEEKEEEFVGRQQTDRQTDRQTHTTPKIEEQMQAIHVDGYLRINTTVPGIEYGGGSSLKNGSPDRISFWHCSRSIRTVAVNLLTNDIRSA